MKSVKIIAYYLPQYHVIPENNEWWGNGFTEWTNTKKSVPLFKGHNQPRIPYSDNYYDLRDIQTIMWQINLASHYGIDGFCFYHYWFKGKRLLHEPIESYLKLDSNKLEYCLSWANESWTRSWNGKNKEVLIKQEYGDLKDWKEHYTYLSQFFKDKKYIKINEKPVVVIHRAGSIKNYLAMIKAWKDFAKEDGYNDLHIVQTLNGFDSHPLPGFDAIVEYEPMYTIKHTIPYDMKLYRYLKAVVNRFVTKLGFENPYFLDFFDYDYVWKNILRRTVNNSSTPIYSGAFVDWDNTSRRGYKATIFKGSSPKKFYIYMKKRLSTAHDLGYSDLLFINAWNEWAEGTYLEPDRKHGFSYLEALRAAKYNESYEVCE